MMNMMNKSSELNHLRLVGYFIFDTLIIDENFHLIIIFIIKPGYMILSNIDYSLITSIKCVSMNVNKIFITLSKAYYCLLAFKNFSKNKMYTIAMYNNMYKIEITTFHSTVIALAL